MSLPLHDYPDWQRALHTADLQQSATNQALNAGGFFSLPVQDMRPYTSFSVQVEVTTVGAPTAYNPIAVVLDWRDAPSLGNPVFEDVHWIWPRGVGGGVFAWESGRFEQQDVVHGPYLTVTLFNNGVNNCTTDIRLYGNTRVIGRNYVRNTPNTGGVAVDEWSSVLLSDSSFVAAGAFKDILMRLCPGPASIMLICGAASTFTFQLYTPLGKLVYSEPVAAGVTALRQWDLPKTALKFEAVNTGGANNNYTVAITGNGQDW